MELLDPAWPQYLMMAVTTLISVALYVGVPIAVVVFARRLLRALDRRSIREEQLAELTERLRRLEARVEEMEGENERLREDQRFTRQLLAGPASTGARA
jgi:cell division protein FtsB